jgi:hypothetical protein
MRPARLVALFATVASFTVAVASCSDAPTARPCTDIPAGGCPLARGVSCEDPACEAVYACRSGNRWELAHTCPPRDPIEHDASLPEAAPPPSFDAAIDAPPGAFGGAGCAVLQLPDCPAGLALGCPSGCCECEDLFVCENEGWSFWGTCLDGQITPATP